MLYLSINNEVPTYLSSTFEKLSQNAIRMIRNTRNYLKLPLLKASSVQKCFSYKGARLWNNLNADVKSAQTQNQLKKIYKISRENFRQLYYFLIFISICSIVYSS